VNAQSLRELFTPRHWALDRPSPFESVRVLDPSPDLEINAQALTAMHTLFPAFRDVQVVQQWGGYIDVTPDIVPYIGTVDALPGLTVATGFSGHGFGIGPARGRSRGRRNSFGRSRIVSRSAFQRRIADRPRS